MTQLDPHYGQYYTGFYQYSVRSIKHDTLLINSHNGFGMIWLLEEADDV